MKVPPPVTCRLSRTGGSSCFVLDSKAKLSECKFRSKQLPKLRADDYTGSFSSCMSKTKKLADVFIASIRRYSGASIADTGKDLHSAVASVVLIRTYFQQVNSCVTTGRLRISRHKSWKLLTSQKK